MSQTSSGIVRFVVLMLATLTFAVVWHKDQQTQAQFAIARRAAAERARAQLLAQPRRPAPPSADAVLPTCAEGVAIADGASPAATRLHPVSTARVEIEMEVPAEIAPGRYRVVDHAGSVHTVRISGVPESAASRDIYILDQSDGTRRCFIRLSELAREAEGPRTAGGAALEQR